MSDEATADNQELSAFLGKAATAWQDYLDHKSSDEEWPSVVEGLREVGLVDDQGAADLVEAFAPARFRLPFDYCYFKLCMRVEKALSPGPLSLEVVSEHLQVPPQTLKKCLRVAMLEAKFSQWKGRLEGLAIAADGNYFLNPPKDPT